MFYSFKDESVDLIGRWSELNNSATATAPGSAFRIAFRGNWITLRFDTHTNTHPYSHLWIMVDGKTKVESPVNPFLRVETEDDGEHILTVIYKSAVEMAHRWHLPLGGKISFKGYDAYCSGTLEQDKRKTIEFVGDSITEGVLVEEKRIADLNDGMYNRPYQDDSTATYAYLTAQNLNLRSLHMGYGAVGVTKGGCGSVPKASEAYPYCFDGHKVEYPSPDYILINHGANDRGNGAEKYIEEYRTLLDTIRAINPTSKLIVLSAFCGVFPKELEKLVNDYNKENGCDILYIDATGWVPPEPIHPQRDGHKIIAENLTAILKKELGL